MNPGGRVMSSTIRREEAGQALVSFLSARFPYHSAAEWARLAGEGALLVNGAPAAADLPLKEKDVVAYRPAAAPERAVDLGVAVLYEDEEILVVNKTGNLPVHPAGKYFRHTLWWFLREQLRIPEPAIINRLDRETSGVTLVAKNPRADKCCRDQFNARTVLKKYTVFTEGAFEAPVRARGYIVAGGTPAVRRKQRFEPSAGLAPEPARQADWADTEFTPQGRHGGFSVVEAVPRTGRLHQIRATLLALGSPVVGDKVYGLDEGVFQRFLDDALTAEDSVKMRLKRQALHAGELTFRHPADGRVMTVAAPLPPDMRGLLEL